MSETPRLPHYAADPDALRLTEAMRALTDTLVNLNCQLGRLYEQRHFELQQKYGQQTFLDFQRTDMRE